MIEHESDLWPERRWGIQCAGDGPVEARPFKTKGERDRWVSANATMRQAVGKRHPVVKALRQQWRSRALLEIRPWKTRGGEE